MRQTDVASQGLGPSGWWYVQAEPRATHLMGVVTKMMEICAHPASITGVRVPELLNGRLRCPKELVDVTPLWINSLFLGKWHHYFLNWNLGKHLERSFL